MHFKRCVPRRWLEKFGLKNHLNKIIKFCTPGTSQPFTESFTNCSFPWQQALHNAIPSAVQNYNPTRRNNITPYLRLKVSRVRRLHYETRKTSITAFFPHQSPSGASLTGEGAQITNSLARCFDPWRNTIEGQSTKRKQKFDHHARFTWLGTISHSALNPAGCALYCVVMS